MKPSQEINWAEKAISSSALKAAKVGTREFLHYYDKPKDKKSHFDFGNALELYLIDKEEFKEKVVVFDESKRPFPDKDYKTAANREWKAAFYANNEGKYLISKTGEESMETCIIMEQLAQMHPAYDLLLGKNYQDPFTWDCPVTGLKRYARTDLFSNPEGIIIDIKTDGKDDFLRACVNNDYFMQAYDHIIGATASGKMERVEAYYWFVFTKNAPYYVDVFKLDMEALLKVEESYWSTLRRLAEDLKGDPHSIVWHDLPISSLKVPNYYK